MQKWILITGCSSGIGLEAARTLTSRGHHVIASARHSKDVEKLRSENLTAILLDVRDSDSLEAGIEQTLEISKGRIDVLFNNAGFGIPGAVEDLTRRALQDQFETNLFGPFELIHRILPIMRRQGFGRIIQNYKKLESRLTKEGAVVPFTLPPEAVIKKLIHAIESPNPRARYYVTFPTYLFGTLKRILSSKMMDRVLLKLARREYT